MQTWTFDAVSGTYKNFILSDKLYEGAFERAEVINWVTPVPGYGKKKGETVNLITMTGPAEPTSAILQENVRIPETTVTLSGTSLTVAEFGQAITYSNIFDELSKYDIKNTIQKRLREQMRLALDFHSGLIAKTASICYTATGATTSQIDTNGTPSQAAAVPLNTFHVRAMRDYMYGTLKAPYFGDSDTFIFIANWAACRGIRNDSSAQGWSSWYQHLHPEKLEKGEIGLIENIRFIETNHDTVLQVATSGGVNFGQGLLLGDEAIAFVEAQTPELRVKVGDDYGRQQGVAWYGILQWGLYHPNANPREARIMRFTGNNFATP